MEGIINLLKTPGMSSHDVVAKMRRLLGEKRIGHAGTLDPGAAGVLVLGVGKATRVLEYLLEQQKTYRFELVLGVATTTEDSFGEILTQKTGTIKREDLEAVLSEFMGPQKQIPPMASAIKVRGKKLYELFREGQEIAREPRDIIIYSLKIISAPQLIHTGDKVLLEAQVSKGTYIRSLCKALGERIGLPAHMGFLLRTASGGLKIADSLLIEEIDSKMKTGQDFIIPADQILDFPVIRALKGKEKALLNGQVLTAAEVEENQLDSLIKNQRVLVYTATNIFVGIYHFLGEDKPILKPEKILIT